MDEMSFERVAEMARRMKAAWVRDHGHEAEEASDMPPVVIGTRSGRMLCLVHPAHGPDGVRRAVFITAAAMRVDEVWLISDSRYSEVAEDEAEPAQGDLQKRWEEGRRDGIREIMLIARLPRIGTPRMIGYPYVRTGRQLRWDDEPIEPESMGGPVMEHAQDGFRQGPEIWADVGPTIDALGDAMGLAEGPEREYHVDRAMARHISGSGYASAVSMLDDHRMFSKGEEADQ